MADFYGTVNVGSNGKVFSCRPIPPTAQWFVKNESALLVLLAFICLTSKSLNGLSLGSLVLLKMPGTSNLETYFPQLVAFHGDLPW